MHCKLFKVTGQGSNTTTGQLLSQGNGTYLIQQSVVDGDPTTHALMSAAAARASPQTETAVRLHVLRFPFQTAFTS